MVAGSDYSAAFGRLVRLLVLLLLRRWCGLFGAGLVFLPRAMPWGCIILGQKPLARHEICYKARFENIDAHSQTPFRDASAEASP